MSRAGAVLLLWLCAMALPHASYGSEWIWNGTTDGYWFESRWNVNGASTLVRPKSSHCDPLWYFCLINYALIDFSSILGPHNRVAVPDREIVRLSTPPPPLPSRPTRSCRRCPLQYVENFPPAKLFRYGTNFESFRPNSPPRLIP